MNSLWFIALWVAVGLIVLSFAFIGGRAGARRAAMTRGGGRLGAFARWAFAIVYIGCGIAIPVAVAVNSTSAVGGTGPLTNEEPNKQLTEGKALFRANCASCHTLAAVNAKGHTGPNLDELGQMTKDRVAKAIKVGGTGQGRMPPEILTGGDAQAVSAYVAKVAGKTQ